MLRLRGELLKELVAARYGSLQDFQLAWQQGDCAVHGEEVPDRSTIYRWYRGGLPRRREQLWYLSSLLDADPFCFLELPKGNEEAAEQALYRAFWLNQWPPVIDFLGAFFGHQATWPPPQFAHQYFGRGWYAQEVTHFAKERVNYHAQIEIAGPGPAPDKPPQVFHFAYRQEHMFVGRWVQYGIVERSTHRISLRSVNGRTHECDVERDDPTIVETWFGLGGGGLQGRVAPSAVRTSARNRGSAREGCALPVNIRRYTPTLAAPGSR